MMNAFNNVYDYFNAILHPPGQNLADRGRRRLFVAFLIAIILALIIFGAVHIRKGDYHYGILNNFLAAVFSGFIISLRYSKTGKTLYRISLVILILLIS